MLAYIPINSVALDTEALLKATGPKGADAYFDVSPPQASKSTHIIAALSSLKVGGRCSIMGGINGNVEIPYLLVMYKNLKIQGMFRYGRDVIESLIKMVENGNLKLGEETGVRNIGPYGLGDIEKALDAAAKEPGWGNQVIVMP